MRPSFKWNHEGKLLARSSAIRCTRASGRPETRRFFLRNPDVPAYAVRTGFTTHAGQRLDLATLQPVEKVEHAAADGKTFATSFR